MFTLLFQYGIDNWNGYFVIKIGIFEVELVCNWNLYNLTDPILPGMHSNWLIKTLHITL